MPRLETPTPYEREEWINDGLQVAGEVTKGNVRGLSHAQKRFRDAWELRSRYRVPHESYRRAFVAYLAWIGRRRLFILRGCPGMPGHVVTDLSAGQVVSEHRKRLGNTGARPVEADRRRLRFVMENAPPELRPEKYGGES